jgi:hypothetical protein
MAGGRCFAFRMRRVAVSGDDGLAGGCTFEGWFFRMRDLSTRAGVVLPLVDCLYVVPLPLTSSTKVLKRDLVVGSAGSGDVTRFRVRNPLSPRPVFEGGRPVILIAVLVGMVVVVVEVAIGIVAVIYVAWGRQRVVDVIPLK